MGVYIKGMEMPMNCYNCWLGHKCPKYEALVWNEINKERKADCPLIPVPPHGRLGDLDKLADNMRSATAGMDHRAIIMHEIRRAPTVIPAEEGET